MIIDEQHPCSEIFRLSRKMIYDHKIENIEQLQQSFRIHPFSRFRKFWELIFIVCSIPNMIFFPIQWAALDYRLTLQGNKEIFKGIVYFFIFCDVFSWADMVLATYTGIYDQYGNISFNRDEIRM